MEQPRYIDWLVEEVSITIKDGIPVKCYKIDYKKDDMVLDDWALHIRRNYIEDEDLLSDAEINGMSVEQYLHDYRRVVILCSNMHFFRRLSTDFLYAF